MIFISVLLGLIDFSDIVILCSIQNSFANNTLSVLISLYYPQVCFHERVAMTVKITEDSFIIHKLEYY